MNAIDEYDIRQTFDALDADRCRGRLDFCQLQTLYLGLGFSIPCRRMTVEQLKKDAQRCCGLGVVGLESLSLTETLHLFKQAKYSRDRTTELNETFDILDKDKDNTLTPQDLVAAAAQANQEENISLALARHMVTLATTTNGENEKQGVPLRKKEFVKFWSPRDP